MTGCNPWTIYQYDDYQGLAVCLYPSDTQNCYPGFFPTAGSLGGLAGEISSVARGCFAKTKIQGSPVQGAAAVEISP